MKVKKRKLKKDVENKRPIQFYWDVKNDDEEYDFLIEPDLYKCDPCIKHIINNKSSSTGPKYRSRYSRLWMLE